MAGDLVEQHPVLFTLAVTMLVEVFPEQWLLGPLLNLFGLGTKGPVKGMPPTITVLDIR